MKVTQSVIGRFHHFHLARQMERLGHLEHIYTGYPRYKLRDEVGIPRNKITCYPWLHAPYMAKGLMGLNRFDRLDRDWAWYARETLDRFVSKRIDHPTILIALSGQGYQSAAKNHSLGGYNICDRGSSHIRYQHELLTEEYERWGMRFRGVDPRIIEKEEREYDLAKSITIPSDFVRDSFIEKGIPSDKLIKIPYGVNLERFNRVSDPEKNIFRVLWVGGVSVRKGFLYALRAFGALNHKNKEFIVIGHVFDEMKPLLQKEKLDSVRFLGTVQNAELKTFYSRSNALLLPSIEEGLSMVQAEALACGCPVISTYNSGATDLFTDGEEGFIVPIRSSKEILMRLEFLRDDVTAWKRMSDRGMWSMKRMKGWNDYGDKFNELISAINQSHDSKLITTIPLNSVMDHE